MVGLTPARVTAFTNRVVRLTGKGFIALPRAPSMREHDKGKETLPMARDIVQTDMGAALTAAIMRKEGLDCACGVSVTIGTPIERIPLMRQLRWAWFAHMAEKHPTEYAKIRFINGRRRNVRRGRQTGGR